MKKIVLLATLTSLIHLPAFASKDEPPEGLRQRIQIQTLNRFPIANLNHVDRDEVHPNCQNGGLLEVISSGFSSFMSNFTDAFTNFSLIPWPDLTEEQTITHLGTWADLDVPGEGLASNGAPLVNVRTSPELRALPQVLKKEDEEELAAVLTQPLNPDFLEQESANERALSQFIDRLKQNPSYSAQDFLRLAKTPDQCEIVFDYLSREKDPVTLLSFEGTEPWVLPEFIKYVNANQGHFKHLRHLECAGHSLSPQDTALLLHWMVMTEREKIQGGDALSLRLTPGRGVNHALLVAIAARYTQRHKHLNIVIEGTRLPSGFETLVLRPNLQLSLYELYSSESSAALFKTMKKIINEDKVVIEFSDGKKLKLKN